MNEIWKDIKGYEGLYQISNLGNVKSFPKLNGRGKGYINKERILKLCVSSTGYFLCGLHKNKKIKIIYPHKLVLLTFKGKKEKSNLTINHINGIKTDNRLENLEYCSQSENQKHAYKIGLQKPIRKITEKDALFIKQNKGKLKQKELAKITNTTISNIKNIHGNYSWKGLQI